MFPSVLHHQQLRIVPRHLACWYWWTVVCTRSSLEPQNFSASVASWGQCCVCASTYRGRTAEDDPEFVGLSGIGSWLCDRPRQCRWAHSQQWPGCSQKTLICWWHCRCCIWLSDGGLGAQVLRCHLIRALASVESRLGGFAAWICCQTWQIY